VIDCVAYDPKEYPVLAACLDVFLELGVIHCMWFVLVRTGWRLKEGRPQIPDFTDFARQQC